MQQGILTAKQEWARYWTLVLAAVVGISFTGIPVHSMAFFIDPLGQQFGWSRAETSIGLSIFALVVIPLGPVAGAMMDRWGTRPLAIGGMALAATLLASLGLTTGALPLWVGQWVCYSVAGAALKATVWTAAVASMFHRSRGMAIAVTLSGSALAQTITPLLTNWLIADYGWRVAYFALGGGWGGITLVLLLLFFRDAHARQRNDSPEQKAERQANAPQLPGLSLAEAARSTKLYRIAAALLINGILSIAVVTHKVSILAEMGVSRDTAAQIAATAGIAGIAGKLLTGLFYDRSHSQWIGITAFGLPALGFLLLLEPLRTPVMIVIAMILMGYGSGAGLQAAVYLTTRHAGQRHYGKIFGTMSIVISLGVGLGPVVGGLVADHFHSYMPLILAGMPLSLLSGLLLIGLGRYPRWDQPANN